MLLALLTIAACDQITPDFSLRDDYMGKAFFQPEKSPQPVARDEQGEPVLKTKRRINLPELPSLRL